MRKLREVLADNPTAAGGILDRLVQNAHRVEMRRDSMRKKRGGTRPS
jgi:DNA replication protein DnaC